MTPFFAFKILPQIEALRNDRRWEDGQVHFTSPKNEQICPNCKRQLESDDELCCLAAVHPRYRTEQPKWAFFEVCSECLIRWDKLARRADKLDSILRREVTP